VTTTTRQIKVFLLDDHDLIRRGLHDLLEIEPDINVVGEASTVAEALTRIPEVMPDVAILDLRLRDGTGVQVCREIRTVNPQIACLILTSFDDRHAVLAAIAAGASGFVLKEIQSSDLVSGVRKAAAGESLIDPALAEQVLSRLSADAGSPPTPDSLSADELAVLRAVASGLSDKEISEKLFMPDRMVKLHFTKMLVKLGLQGHAGLLGG
jgi:two-component system, NarL family, response regulator DevR